ncbi:HNH endonuclease [Paraburkholderia silviterrae]
MPEALPPAPRREAIPRVVQREVWQRDAGRCVECGTREKLCFDHIVPFSRGGSNTVRNIQLLCEGCNLTKGNRI